MHHGTAPRPRLTLSFSTCDRRGDFLAQKALSFGYVRGMIFTTAVATSQSTGWDIPSRFAQMIIPMEVGHQTLAYSS